MAHGHKPQEPGPVGSAANRIGLHRSSVAVVMLSLVAVSCGGSSDSSSAPTSPQTVAASETAIEPSADAEVKAVVDAVVDAHGEDGGFDAVIWAFERGYLGEQLFAGALEGRLQADGVIIAATGDAEGPEGSPLGLILLPGPEFQSMEINAVPAVYRADLHMAALGRITIEQAREKLGTLTGLLAVFATGRAGYSAGQVIETLILGGTFDELEYREETGGVGVGWTCFFVRDSTGQVVVPLALDVYAEERKCSRAIEDLAETENADESSDLDEEEKTESEDVAEAEVDVGDGLVFRGFAEATLVYADQDGQPPKFDTKTCEPTVDAELTIHPDGGAVLVVTWWDFVVAPGFRENCKPTLTTSRDSTVYGTWTGGRFFVGVTEPYHRSVSPVEGTFDDDSAFLPATSVVFESGPAGWKITGELSFTLERFTG